MAKWNGQVTHTDILFHEIMHSNISIRTVATVPLRTSLYKGALLAEALLARIDSMAKKPDTRIERKTMRLSERSEVITVT